MNINYDLSAAADVEVRILSASGSTIRRVTAGSTRAAGVNQATWDLKSDSGVSVPAGAYLVEVRAQAVGGRQTVKQQQPFLVVR